MPDTPIPDDLVGAFQIEGAAIELTVSVGATAAQSGITREIDLLATADAALYNAKAAGRNCVVVG